ncbi:bifunctional diaminohydroxyphosphoribosylaminopyrimidine deaminase/5-amino-6-(5-phosphoribosylamino)uracil reductase [Pedobacter psychrophilus]|uniref:Riboflavin biosynthesis protein RibD n=1 Tax=Pedobacter psychrophilus TaxID=1826909 RepID=A0A179DFX7_9SPHI|nr:bifunctional diaminohydroxyphosphoribosylaminopyrimidine deaminase/5-amino-6-(5-phosphoribosylamino)uracil reductase RibD [Pedobacter psychrophilus]OAQ39931.1 bifunctional diaminohydroxyphosphoribosylaminopyrimidine deaminase/5-amino-6-(5-phosphoribosylamino)uracil reductase [Pedobacter psychrophilus]
MTNESVFKRAIYLAKLGLGHVSPNPMVGAIIIVKDKIIGEGYHQKYGGPHAEVNAINQVLENYKNAAELLKEATIYVTLEPCSHFGKTPPCADLIIKHQIPNVVVGCLDPFESVNGKGIAKLRAAGINVITGVLETECLDLNKRFFTKVLKQRPYVILKWAQTRDGYFAPTLGNQQWISGSEAKRLVHLWRSQEDCVLVGKNTALTDNPQLNVRLVAGRNPIRAVIDQKLTLPKTLHLFDNTTKTFVFNDVLTDIKDKTLYISIEDFKNFLPQYILFQLYLQDIQSVIIEGGTKTLQSFIDADLWDEARIFTATKIWGEGKKSPNLKGELISQDKIGEDLLTVLKPL